MWYMLTLPINIVITVSLLLLAIASCLRQGYKKPINQLFAAASVLMAIFLISYNLTNDIALPNDIALYDVRILFVSSYAMVIFFTQFVTKLINEDWLNAIIKRALIPIWLICAIGGTPLVISGVFIENETYNANFEPLVWLYILGVLSMIGLISYVLAYGLKHKKGLVRRQIVSTGIGLMLSLPMTLILSLIVPLVTGPGTIANVVGSLGTVSILFLVFSLYYGVVRYHLFDIRLAAVRTLTYILSLSVLVGMYFGLATIVSNVFNNNSLTIDQSPLSLLVILVLLLIFQPIKLVFDRLTNRIFYRDYYQSDEFFARFNQILTSTNDLRVLLERSAKEIATTMKAEQAFFYINTFSGHYIIAGTAGHNQLPKDDALRLQDVYGKRSGVIVAPMLAEDDPVRHLMISHGIELMLPLFQADVVGYLCLGFHRTSHYTTRDIKVLGTIADESIIAIHNTLSVEEVRMSNTLLRQMDKAKDEFVSVASHELRTPMTVIRGSISLLEREQLGPVNDQQKDVLNRMSVNTKALIDLVNDMLDLSKLEANKLELKLTDQPIQPLVNEALSKIKVIYETKGVKLSYSGEPVMVKTDSDKFERILLNLLSNAYKFTDAGGSVTITSTINQADHLATVCVTDTGTGIPAEALGSLFKKFSQVDDYLQRQTSGTGLGLAICKELVEKLGGTIWVKSKVGEGSTFCFTVAMSSKNDNDTLS